VSLEGLKRRKANAERYAEFKRAGDLTVFAYSRAALDDPEFRDFPADLLEGALVMEEGDAQPPDIAYVVALVERIVSLGLLAQVGVDAAGIGAVVDALADIGISQDDKNLDAVRQGIALMGAIKTIERKLADGSFRHGGAELLKWSVENLKVVPTATAMRVARDESGYGKVDPVMALFNAAHLMSLNHDTIGVRDPRIYYAGIDRGANYLLSRDRCPGGYQGSRRGWRRRESAAELSANPPTPKTKPIPTKGGILGSRFARYRLRRRTDLPSLSLLPNHNSKLLHFDYRTPELAVRGRMRACPCQDIPLT